MFNAVKYSCSFVNFASYTTAVWTNYVPLRHIDLLTCRSMTGDISVLLALPGMFLAIVPGGKSPSLFSARHVSPHSSMGSSNLDFDCAYVSLK